MAVKRIYRVEVERGRTGRWWLIGVPQVPAARSQARRLDQAEDVARDLIALLTHVIRIRSMWTSRPSCQTRCALTSIVPSCARRSPAASTRRLSRPAAPLIACTWPVRGWPDGLTMSLRAWRYHEADAS